MKKKYIKLRRSMAEQKAVLADFRFAGGYSMNIERKHSIEYIQNPEASETIVFANGFGTDQSIWTDISNHFKSRYSILLFETVGSAKSDLSFYSASKYDSLKAYAKDLLELCTYMNIENGILVAHSVSGMIGLLSSIQKHSLFSDLILIGSSPRYLNDADYLGGFNPEDLENLYESMRQNYYAWASGFASAAMNTPEKPELADYFARKLSAIQPDVALSVAKTIFNSDYRKELSKLDVPCLIVKTKEDIAVPPEVPEYMHKKISRSQIKEIDAKGHFPHFSAPGEVIGALESYLGRK